MANTLNLDRSQRLDVVCKRGDTFKMNLELKDDDGTALELNPTNPQETTPYYAFKMEVRAADTDDVIGDGAGGYLIQKFATIKGRTGSVAPTVSDSTNLATFKIDHEDMGINTSNSTNNLDAGVYVYDIEKRLYNSAPSPMTPNFAAALQAETPADVETILYGVFTVNEDITL
jgi:hypothetical protein